MTSLEDGARQVRIQRVVATGGSIVIQVAGDLVVSEEGLAASWATVATRPGECPYPGMEAFGPGQAKWFFGRDRLTGDLLGMLDTSLRAGGGGPFIVVGASGAGKSSLLAAGLVRALGDGRLAAPGSARWPVLAITPGSRPLETLTEAINTCAAELASRTTVFPPPPRSDWESAFANFREMLRRNHRGGDPQRVTVVLDKLEELFTAGCSEGERHEFLNALAAITGPTLDGPAGLVVLGMRADFYASATQYPELRDALQYRQLVVGAMTLAETTQAITGPARAAGLHLESGLTERVLRDLGVDVDGTGYEPGRLPLLGQALRATWQRRSGEWLTISGYEDAGGIGGAISKAAEDAYKGLDDQAQQTARQLFLSMVQIGSGEPGGEGTADTRRRVSKSRLCSAAPDPHTAKVVLDIFTEARLVTSSSQTAEITHEALLSRWPRLRDWIEQDRAGHLIRQPLEEAADAWDRAGRDAAADLYTGSRLVQARVWASDLSASRDLSTQARDFLAASGLRQQSALRRRNRVIAVLAVLFLCAVSAAAFATREDRTANHQRSVAVAGQLAAESEALDATNPVEAASLAAAAWKIAPIAEAQTAQLDVLAQPERAVFTAAGGNVNAMAFSADAKLFAAVSDTGMAQVWNTATHHQVGKTRYLGHSESYLGGYSIFFTHNDMAITLRSGGDRPSQFYNISTGHALGSPFRIKGNQFNSAMLSADGKFAVVGGNLNSSNWSILDVSTHRQIGPLLNTVIPLAFSPDGTLLATMDMYARSVQILDVATQGAVGTPIRAGSSSYAPAVAFSADSKVIAVNGRHSVSLWNIARQHTIGSPIAVNASDMAFSPDGKILATVSAAGTAGFANAVDLWDVATGQELGSTLTIESTLPGGLVFSPDGTVLAAAAGATVSFWDVAVSRQIGASLNGAAGPIAVSPDGQFLAATQHQGNGLPNAELWDIRRHRKIGGAFKYSADSGNRVTAVAVSPDDKVLALGGQIGVGTELWDVASHRKLETIRVRGDSEIGVLAFSPTGKYLAIGGGGYTWLWNMSKHHAVGRPIINQGDLNSAAFSPDGKVLAFTDNSQVRLFSVATQRQVGVLRPEERVLDMAFSPDGEVIATADGQGVILWQVADQQQIGVPLDVGTGPINALAFSPDGTNIAAGGENGSVSLWDVATHEKIGSSLTVNNNSISGLAFSPNSSVLVVADQQETRLWGIAPDHNVSKQVCAIADGSMAQNEWDSYVKSYPYQLTCP